MRAVAVESDAIVATSSLWMTTATAIRSAGECFVIDSPYFPDELDALPSLLAQTGFEPVGLLATHADFDHLLGRLAYPGLSLGVGESTALRLRAEPGVVQRELRDNDGEMYVTRQRPLSLGTVQSLPVPGKMDLGRTEIELHPAEGHTADGTAYFWREKGVLVAGDYLSDVEIPTLASIDDYRATLAHLGRLIEDVQVVVPGHGSPHDRETALRLLDEDVDYLDALERGDERPRLPRGRATSRQRALHAENLSRVAT